MGATAGPTPYGDSAPSRSDLSKIIGHPASIKEHNIARGIHVDSTEKAIHDKASAAVAQLDVSHEARSRIMEGVEREAMAVWRRARKNNDGAPSRRNGGVSLEKAVALAFLNQCRGIGRSVEEMQRALARAGFGIRLESVHITVSSDDPASLRLLVNGCERSVRVVSSPKTVRVPIYLSDLLDGGDRPRLTAASKGEDAGGGVVEISVGGNGTIIDVRSPYEFTRPDWRRVEVFAGRRCFYLFKAQKEASVRTGPLTTAAAAGAAMIPGFAPPRVNVEALMKRFLPSKFPVSAMLMDTAGCLRKVELRFASLLREMMTDARGRAPDSVAASALYLADQAVFGPLPDAEKGRAWSMIVRMGLANGTYLGRRGFLLKSEVGFDESVVQEAVPADDSQEEGDDDDDRGVGGSGPPVTAFEGGGDRR